jgi:RNA polymerase sigma-70 factor (ECF subfamily)
VRNDGEAEDVTQDAYVRAYQHLHQFEGRASFSTWLTRIAVNEALARARRHARVEEMETMEESRRESMQPFVSHQTPEQSASAVETRSLIEQSIDALPDLYREVFVLRDIEEMSTGETAASLEITEENVKTRLHRARALMRKELYSRAGARSSSAFQFLGDRCNRLVRNVMARIAPLPLPGGRDSQRLTH